VREIVATIHEEDRQVIAAVEKALPALTAFIEAAEPRFNADGRLVYIGAGTSGRLGVLDASECPPTFQVDPGRVIGIIAGGDRALRKSSEGMEDDPLGGKPELDALNLTEQDIIFGIAAGGTTPYVLGGLAYAKDVQLKILTGLLVCSPVVESTGVDHVILIETGPEVITGSTRLKAGTATKLALNTITTTLMIRSGRVYQNLMVDLRATSDKLRDRAARIIATLTGLSRIECFKLLEAAGNHVKTAIVMHELKLPRALADQILAEHNGRIDRVLSGVHK
jgi:N-acetylmuramic acid 6-phosphate etherase